MVENLFEKMNSKINVVVIGAGAAGIAAATRLYERGIVNTVILEAESHIGGRIRTVNLPENDGFVELGAQWVHGEKKNIVFEILSGKDLFHRKEIEFSNFEFVRSTTEAISRDITDQLYENFLLADRDLEESELKVFSNSGEYFIAQFEEMFQKRTFDILPIDVKNEFIEWCQHFINHYDGTDSWFDSSILTRSEYWKCEGNQNIAWKNYGCKSILSALMENSEGISKGKFSQTNIITNKKVKKIRVHDNHVTVECVDGSNYSADHVILTASLGVLKENHKELFENVFIPDTKIQAIEKLGMGSVVKIFLKFPHMWIPENINGVCILWKNEDKEEYTKQGLQWITDIFAFCRIDNASNVICAWVTGSSGRKVELMDEEVIRKEVTRLLQKILGHRYEIPDAEYCIKSTWSSNSNFRGCYSFLARETDSLPSAIDSLAAPLENKNNLPVILFAGEATHKHYYSTIHGAIETGWREADRILSLTQENIKH